MHHTLLVVSIDDLPPRVHASHQRGVNEIITGAIMRTRLTWGQLIRESIKSRHDTSQHDTRRSMPISDAAPTRRVSLISLSGGL